MAGAGDSRIFLLPPIRTAVRPWAVCLVLERLPISTRTLERNAVPVRY